jgi:2-dehydro-3-deoxyphosphogluconate aldolase/(4S)-4-hydroxy-2-oxoglutarate aldolase
MEMMKQPFKGTNGHIAIATNSVKRALYQLKMRGFEADESSIKYDKATGVMNVAYLKHEFGGFAVHLVLKK